MKERIFVIVKCLIILLIVMALFNIIRVVTVKLNVNGTSKLVIFGDNIDKSYTPYIEDGKIYITYETLKDFIDENIYYDASTQKIIITNEDYVYKFKIGERTATKNMQEYNITYPLKVIDETVYIDSDLIKDIYNIKIQYEEETDTISIDKRTNKDLHLNYNDVKLYSNIRTDSQILETLNKENTVVVYTESLKHSRWYKVKTDSGKIGYIEKGAITVDDKKNIDESPDSPMQNEEKKIMFWQYGSNLDTLGEKIDGVNVAMPTWFKLSDGMGAVEINYNKEYYNKAKSNGYELYPIITNNFDSSEVDSKELTSAVFNNEEARETLIRNIVDIVKDYNLDGINIDFESMKSEDKYLFTQFLRELYPILKSMGKKLSVDVYFTDYIDRSGVGKACDYVMLMGYDQRGAWSKSEGSISEISWVEKNVKSLIEDSNIDSRKIILGVPFYTRLWKIDSDNNLTSETYSIKQCQQFLETYNLSTTYDEQSGQNYVSVVDKGITYKLWLEDQTSIGARADIVNNYNLAGITAWQKGLETEEIWNVIKDKIK